MAKDNVTPIASGMSARERIAAARKRQSDMRDAYERAVEEQTATDEEAIAEVSAERGFGRFVKISIATCWKEGAGAPVLVAFAVPNGSSKLLQRFIETVNRAKEGSKERLTAQDALATECMIYPAKNSEEFKAVLELAPLILSQAALQIVTAAQGQAEETGKE